MSSSQSTLTVPVTPEERDFRSKKIPKKQLSTATVADGVGDDKDEHNPKRTCEEGETPLFCERAKLYQFNKWTKERKESDVGDMKILRHRQNNKYHFMMRFEQDHNVLLNQQIQRPLDFEKLPNSINGCYWFGMNLAEGCAQPTMEKHAVRFKNKEQLLQFNNTAYNCLDELSGDDSGAIEGAVEPAENSTAEKSTAVISLTTDMSPSAGCAEADVTAKDQNEDDCLSEMDIFLQEKVMVTILTKTSETGSTKIQTFNDGTVRVVSKLYLRNDGLPAVENDPLVHYFYLSMASPQHNLVEWEITPASKLKLSYNFCSFEYNTLCGEMKFGDVEMRFDDNDVAQMLHDIFTECTQLYDNIHHRTKTPNIIIASNTKLNVGPLSTATITEEVVEDKGEHDLHVQPIISLSDVVEVRTGEEDETPQGAVEPAENSTAEKSTAVISSTTDMSPSAGCAEADVTVEENDYDCVSEECIFLQEKVSLTISNETNSTKILTFDNGTVCIVNKIYHRNDGHLASENQESFHYFFLSVALERYNFVKWEITPASKLKLNDNVCTFEYNNLGNEMEFGNVEMRFNDNDTAKLLHTVFTGCSIVNYISPYKIKKPNIIAVTPSITTTTLPSTTTTAIEPNLVFSDFSFGNSSTFNFTPVNKPNNEPTSTATITEEEVEDKGEHDLHVQPIISLSDVVEVITGEEGETLLFPERAELFRFDTKTKGFVEGVVGPGGSSPAKNSAEAEITVKEECEGNDDDNCISEEFVFLQDNVMVMITSKTSSMKNKPFDNCTVGVVKKVHCNVDHAAIKNEERFCYFYLSVASDEVIMLCKITPTSELKLSENVCTFEYDTFSVVEMRFDDNNAAELLRDIFTQIKPED